MHNLVLYVMFFYLATLLSSDQLNSQFSVIKVVNKPKEIRKQLLKY